MFVVEATSFLCLERNFSLFQLVFCQFVLDCGKNYNSAVKTI